MTVPTYRTVLEQVMHSRKDYRYALKKQDRDIIDYLHSPEYANAEELAMDTQKEVLAKKFLSGTISEETWLTLCQNLEYIAEKKKLGRNVDYVR